MCDIVVALKYRATKKDKSSFVNSVTVMFIALSDQFQLEVFVVFVCVPSSSVIICRTE